VQATWISEIPKVLQKMPEVYSPSHLRLIKIAYNLLDCIVKKVRPGWPGTL